MVAAIADWSITYERGQWIYRSGSGGSGGKFCSRPAVARFLKLPFAPELKMRKKTTTDPEVAISKLGVYLKKSGGANDLVAGTDILGRRWKAARVYAESNHEHHQWRYTLVDKKGSETNFYTRPAVARYFGLKGQMESTVRNGK